MTGFGFGSGASLEDVNFLYFHFLRFNSMTGAGRGFGSPFRSHRILASGSHHEQFPFGPQQSDMERRRYA